MGNTMTTNKIICIVTIVVYSISLYFGLSLFNPHESLSILQLLIQFTIEWVLITGFVGFLALIAFFINYAANN